jgi:hypothetical protein
MKTTRRSFIKQAASVAGMSAIAPASVLGKSGSVAAGDRITVGGIGLGPRGREVLAAFLRQPDVRFVAIADVQESRREIIRKTVDRHYGNQDCKAYIDMHEVLARPDIDAVVIATGDRWHGTASIYAARAGKGWMYEGGIREPLLVRWPGVVKPGSIIHTPVSSPDFFPTLLEATGTKPQAGQILDGVSLMPLLKGGGLQERPIFWHYPHYGNQGGAPCSAVRRGDWKLIEWAEDNRSELFNLAQDIGEQTNLADKEPQRVADLRAELAAWQKQVGAKFPISNPNFNPAKPSGRAAQRNPNP